MSQFTIFRALLLATVGALALSACQDRQGRASDDAPSGSVIKFVLPSFKAMPQVELLLRRTGAEPLPARQPLHMALANIGYLAVRDCPDARDHLTEHGLVIVPLKITSGSPVYHAERDMDHPTGLLKGGALECVTGAVAKQRPDPLEGLNVTVDVILNLPERAYAP